MIQFIAVIALSAASILLRAFTLSTLWNWFVAPTFNVATLSMAVAFGIATLLSYSLYDSRIIREDAKAEDAFNLVFTGIGISSGALLVGWLTTICM